MKRMTIRFPDEVYKELYKAIAKEKLDDLDAKITPGKNRIESICSYVVRLVDADLKENFKY